MDFYVIFSRKESAPASFDVVDITILQHPYELPFDPLDTAAEGRAKFGGAVDSCNTMSARYDQKLIELSNLPGLASPDWRHRDDAPLQNSIAGTLFIYRIDLKKEGTQNLPVPLATTPVQRPPSTLVENIINFR